MIWKGTYETALHYGFSYDTAEERLFILKVLEASVSRGSAWDICNKKVDEMLTVPCDMWITSDENTSKQQFIHFNILKMRFLKTVFLTRRMHFGMEKYYSEKQYHKRRVFGMVFGWINFDSL